MALRTVRITHGNQTLLRKGFVSCGKRRASRPLFPPLSPSEWRFDRKVRSLPFFFLPFLLFPFFFRTFPFVLRANGADLLLRIRVTAVFTEVYTTIRTPVNLVDDFPTNRTATPTHYLVTSVLIFLRTS